MKSLIWWGQIDFYGTTNTETDVRTRLSGCRWLMPEILATQEAETKRIAVRSQTRQIINETLS
jgi:hypothetical protein